MGELRRSLELFASAVLSLVEKLLSIHRNHNLYRLKLDRKRRCCYTIVANHEGLKVIVLEVFPDHKSYNRRFGYKKG
jgi:hypothetical protein